MFLSSEFWLFVLAVLALHNLTRGRAQNLGLLAASYALYAVFDLRFLALLVVATTVTYATAQKIGTSPRRRLYFWLGILFNLGVLAVFKYLRFFVETLIQLLGRSGGAAKPGFLALALPLGISFYTFRLLSYLFDVYSGRLAVSDSWVNVALYVAFFPQIVAGPIERAAGFLPRLQATRRLDSEQFLAGLAYIGAGLFYKIAIADPLVPWLDAALRAGNDVSPSGAIAVIVWFSVRIYADFAGYSALAIGVSRWFGLPAVENFRQPYLARSVTEFWTRWHISLSSWLRDYVFLPLSRRLARLLGGRFAFLAQSFALFVTMLAIGLWHGASLTFVVWGLLHFGYLLAERLLGRVFPLRLSGVPRVVATPGRTALTLTAVGVAWVFFRSETLPDALRLLGRTLAPDYSVAAMWAYSVLAPLGLLFAFDLLQTRLRSVAEFWNLRLVWRVALIIILLLALFILGKDSHDVFLYAAF